MCDKISLILLTGMPGIGKTTITKRLYNSLTANEIKCMGFYTEEIRNSSNGERLGFDIISLHDNERKTLARNENSAIKRPKIGKYSVYIDEFEIIALKTLSNFSNSNINSKYCLIIDEIGKMELLSKKFETEVKDLIQKIKRNDIKVIATIPYGNQLKVVEELLSIPNGKLFQITKLNRNQIYNEIEQTCLNFVK